MRRSCFRNRYLHKGFALALALSVSVSMLPVQDITAAEQTKETAASDEEKREETAYEKIDIRTAEEFAGFAAKCYIDSWSENKYVSLKADIDLTGLEFQPIPVFRGTFDGAGHTVSGFDYTGDGYVVGLFRYIESKGTVQNLTLKGNIDSGNERECIGSICGINYGTIRNCSFQGTVSGRDTVGGIAGINEDTGTISGSSAKGRIKGYYSTGGICGINHGALNYCTNRAGINDDSAWVEEDDEMGTGVEIIRRLTAGDDHELHSGVDTGGIAGFSDGVISRCTNSGTVGYEHTGYNIGGIAGRQSGIVSLSTNNGAVYGRKDVGGIVGQMEPFIEIDEAESLRNAIDKLHDAIEKTVDDMDAATDVVKGDVDTMKSYADSAIDTGDELVTRLTDFVDDNVEEVNSVSERMEHIIDMLPDILDDVSAAGDAMSGLRDVAKRLAEDLNVLGKLDDSPYDETDYSRIALLSTVGGTLHTDSPEPGVNDTVTITADPDDGYKLKDGSLTVTDADGKKTDITPVGGNKYTFIMPKGNVTVTAQFVYKGAFLVKSTVGGTVWTKDNGDTVTFRATASSGYEFKCYDYAGTENTDSEITLSKTEYIRDNTSVAVKAVFEKTDTDPAGDPEEPSVTDEPEKESSDSTESEPETETESETETETESETKSETETESETESETKSETETGSEAESETKSETEEESGTETGPEAESEPEKESEPESEPEPESEKELEPEKESEPEAEVRAHTYTVNLHRYLSDAGSRRADVRYVKKEDTSADTGEEEDTSADTGEKPKKHRIRTASSTGGTVSVSGVSVEEGEKVYITPMSERGYVLNRIAAKQSGSGLALKSENDGKQYSFTMPDSDVEVTALYEPVDIILKSNLSGNAAYSCSAEGKVTVNVKPGPAYTVSSITVTDADGNRLSVSRKQSGSYLYEFDGTKMSKAPCTVNITFNKENKKQAADTSKTNIDDSIDNLVRASDNVRKSVNRIKDIVMKPGGGYKSWNELTGEEKDEVSAEVLNLVDCLSDMSSAGSSALSSLTTIYNILAPYVTDAARAARNDIEKATDHIHGMLDSLREATNGVKGVVNYMNAQPDIRFAKLGDDFDITRENFHDRLKGLSDSIKSLSDNASHYSKTVNDDLRAVNDRLNVVFNLLADRMVDIEQLSIEELYEEVDDENIDSITTGRADACKNTGVIKGDINVGGIAGSMAIDDEDPEDSAAGAIEYEIGRRFITKCLVTDSVNEGYITSKKDGAGGICGYMNHGIIIDSECYGSVESTEGDYVGGICGESLTIIRRCYALCSVSGNKNVGGIAGYAETLKNCYSMADVEAQNGRFGAIAGQIAVYGEVDTEAAGQEPKVVGNYYVGDDIYGIDNISYIGVAEPVSYHDLLTVENLPTQFWHLRVIYRIEDTYLGSEEVRYGTVLDRLNYPPIPEKEGFYGVWPDVTDKKMSGTVVIQAEYRDNVTVVQSNTGGENADDGSGQRPYALVEDIFTEDTVLNVSLSDTAPPAEAEGNRHVIYAVSLENSGIRESDSFALRVLNPYEEAEVYGYRDGTWSLLESKSRGRYLQVMMTGTREAFCVVENKSDMTAIAGMAAAAAAVLILFIIAGKKIRTRRRKKGPKNTQQAKK